MRMTVAERTMQQVMLLEARKSKRSRKHNKKSTRETENGIIISELDRKWCDFGHGVGGSGSQVNQRRIGSIEAILRVGLLRSFLRTIGSQVVTTGDTQRVLGEVRLLELVPDLATKYSDKITTRRSFAVSTSAEMRVLAEVMDSLMAGHVGRAGDIMAQRLPPKGDRGAKQSTWNWPLWTELRLSPQDCEEI